MNGRHCQLQMASQIAVSVPHISGRVILLVAFAQSRCVLTDMRIDSVPPEVAVDPSQSAEDQAKAHRPLTGAGTVRVLEAMHGTRGVSAESEPLETMSPQTQTHLYYLGLHLAHAGKDIRV